MHDADSSMLDDNGEGDSAPSNGRRPSLNRAHTTATMEGRASSDRDAPRVRFSQDVERIRAAAPASSSQVPETPDLTIDTTVTLQRPSGMRSQSSLSSKKATSPSSPISPRTRDRGYSLRRTLFARGIDNHSEADESPIELTEAGSSREHGQYSGRSEGEASSSQSTAAVHPSDKDDDLSAVPNIITESHSGSQSKTSKDEKELWGVSLPNYDAWAKKRNRQNVVAERIKKCQKLFERHILRRKEILPSVDGRHIGLDASRAVDLVDERTGNPYIGNTIRSSRYTVWNFLPRQLIFQFSKLANAYFLLVSILQMIPGFSTTGTYTTIAPLLVFVALSMAKEGYDDVRRYKLDKIENNRETSVLHAYRSVREGMVVEKGLKNWKPKHKGNLSRRLGFKTKSNATGQVNPIEDGGPKVWATLKWRSVKVGDIIKLERDEHIPADIILLHADGPNGIAYIDTMALDGETNMKTKQAPPLLVKQCGTSEEIAACRAHIVVEDPNIDLYNFDGKVTVDGETLPLTTNEIVFRGSTLRNTNSAIGMVINTGEECKIRMNANKNPRIKAPAMQIITNKIVIVLVVFVVLLSLFCTIAYKIWSNQYESEAWYLEDAQVPFAQIIVGFIILYNTLIPLSLYVSLEIIKVGQLILMNDVEMYDPVSNTPMICNTTTILENLGQVDYIFSDKTGTLTDNVMRFRKLSVAGYAWLHDFDLQKDAAELEQKTKESERKKHKGKSVAKPFSKTKRPNLNNRNNSEMTTTSARRSGSIWRSSARPTKAQLEFRTEELLHFMAHKPHSVFTKKARMFLLSLALCHTCLPEVQENGDLDFQAASPDELALVRAAQDLGWLVIDRPAKSITLKYPSSPDSSESVTESYDVLDVIEFSSKRKRMSIIVRFPNGKICVFCKGADSAILPRLKLAPIALQKASEVSRRSSKRKSLEAEEALRRMSEHSPRSSYSRPSIALSRPSIGRRSTGAGRPSIASTKLQPIRDELDSWLKDRETESQVVPDDLSAYHSPRASMGRLSFASDRRSSTHDDDFNDETIDEAIVLDDAAIFERCFQHIDDFATEGLRTLLFGYRFLDDQEYEGWKKIYFDATTSLVDRQELIESAGEMIEQNFDLAGATAIEDKLQKGVPQTIDKLRRANIKIWMLTGDKRETAINIAHSARLCKNYSDVVILDHTTNEVEQRMATTLLEINKGTIPHSVIVVDGQTLSEIEANETLSLLFFDLVCVADSVICCRASPSQKAALVKKIRTKVKRSITLAIGDGANDIAMIQEAHVGIGISGKEGLQAARISDYSIAQFRFLQRLLLVHGRWNYARTGKYILTTFWKELLFYLIQALYQRWTGYTGTSLFESTSLTVFNTLFTSLAVILLGMFEQDLNRGTLLAVPELYTYGQRNEAFNIKKYIAWMFMASSESMILYFCMWGLFGTFAFNDNDDALSLGTLCFASAVIFINIKGLILETHNKTIILFGGFFITIGGWWAWTVALSGLYPATNKTYPLYPLSFNFISHFGRSLTWWLILFLSLASVTLLELGISSIRKTFWPTDTDIFQELQNDPLIRQRFDEAVKREEDGDALEDVHMTRETKVSTDLLREGEIQELLNNRPSAVVATPRSSNLDAEVIRSPVEVDDMYGERRASGQRLTRRKFSIDMNTEHMGSGKDKTRHSVDIAEALARR